ncbi:DUF4232 domain-containing protein [Saccharopolyspora dendranthemae]|uniref:Uncharacterized protein DUF4232 n=1 Tax=Saccharopolyspora dendranthemae TaxID=1181886 RepID=A0A561VAL3_9PSEU|nr:DUF4232 domain-containing protein [Saccharopolyspora dendranthemae]TWG08659.1 uncharacterized protein DUF4232 [Saccharopolyspora dendranthemae]
MKLKTAVKMNGKRLGAFGVVLAAVAASSACGQQAQQAQQPPAVVTVTQPAPQETTESQDSSEETSEQGGSSETKVSHPEEIPTQKPCQTSQLRARFYPDTLVGQHKDPTQPVRASRTKLRLANVGAKECTVHGDARVEFLDDAGAVMPATFVDKAGTPPAEWMSIGTREGVAQELYWVYETGDCVDDPRKVRIYPPDNTEPITLDWNFGTVCGDRRVERTHLRSD